MWVCDMRLNKQLKLRSISAVGVKRSSEWSMPPYWVLYLGWNESMATVNDQHMEIASSGQLACCCSSTPSPCLITYSLPTSPSLTTHVSFLCCPFSVWCFSLKVKQERSLPSMKGMTLAQKKSILVESARQSVDVWCISSSSCDVT